METSPRWGAFGLSIVVALLIYIPSWSHELVLWDDDEYITQNPLMTAPDGLRRIWLTLESPQYYPLTFSMLRLEHALWGDGPAGYHVVNTVLHAACAGLVWLLVFRLGGGSRVASIAALLFAVHPLHVESVSWVAGRKNVLSGLFFLLAVLMYVRHRRRMDRAAYWWCIGFGLAAMLSKTATVTLPLVLLLFDLLYSIPPGRRLERRMRGGTVRMLPLLAAGVALTVVTMRVDSPDVGEALPLLSRVLVAGAAVWFYAGKLLLPVGLCPLYPRWAVDAGSVWWWLPLGVLAGLVAAVIVAARRRRPIGAWSFGLYLLALLPMLGLVHFAYMDYSFVADHFVYLSAVGFLTLVAMVLEVLRRRAMLAMDALTALILVVLAVRTVWQQRTWRDTATVLSRALECAPSFELAYVNLARDAMRRGREEEAITWLERGIERKPEFAQAHHLLGNVYARRGETLRAMEEYRRALALAPGQARTLRDVALLHLEQNEAAEAVRLLREAIARDGLDAELQFHVARALKAAGKMEESVAAGRAALRLNPRHASAAYNLANTLFELRRTEEAEAAYAQAIAAQPEMAAAYYNLGVVRRLRGDRRGAAEAWERGVRLAPNDVEMLTELARVRATAAEEGMRDAGQALRLCERVERLLPRVTVRLLDVRAAAYAAAGDFSRALQDGQRAAEMAELAGAAEQAGMIRARLHLYRQGKAYVDAD